MTTQPEGGFTMDDRDWEGWVAPTFQHLPNPLVDGTPTWCGEPHELMAAKIRPRLPVCAECHMKAMHHHADRATEAEARAHRFAQIIGRLTSGVHETVVEPLNAHWRRSIAAVAKNLAARGDHYAAATLRSIFNLPETEEKNT